MADSPWDDKLKSFLKKTSTDFKRFSREVKDEAEKLMTEVQDPEKQKKLREGLKEVGTWARRAAEDVATVVEGGVKKAEVVIGKASERVGDFIATPNAPSGTAADIEPPPAPTPPSPPPVMEEDAPVPVHAKKTVGRREKPSVAKKKQPQKTIGRVKDDGEE